MTPDKEYQSMIPLYENHPALAGLADAADAALALTVSVFRAGGRMLLCGNGGSAADCDHIVGELAKGFLSRRQLTDAACGAFRAVLAPDDPDLPLLCGSLQGGLPAVSLPSQTALVSAFCNDVDPALVYAQLVLALGKPGDLLVCLSTSGNSRNVVLAAKTARARGLHVLSLVGARPCALDGLSDVVLHAPSTETYRSQEYHLPLYHWLCAGVEQALFGQ